MSRIDFPAPTRVDRLLYGAYDAGGQYGFTDPDSEDDYYEAMESWKGKYGAKHKYDRKGVTIYYVIKGQVEP